MECKCCNKPLGPHKHWLNEKIAICNCCFYALLKLKKDKPGIADSIIFLLENNNVPLELLNPNDEIDKNEL